MSDKNSMLNRSAIAGLALGGVSIAYMLCTMLTGLAGSKLPALMTIINLLLWIVKFCACIYLMRLFMQNFAIDNPDADKSRVFRFGMLTALMSAFLYSSFYLIDVLYIQPDTIKQAFSIVMDNPLMDSNSRQMLESMMPKMPVYGFFGNLIYCWLFGTVLSAIFSPKIASGNPFEDQQ